MAYDDDDAEQHNSPLVPWILVVAASVLGVGASYYFYVGRDTAQASLAKAKQASDEYRLKANNAEGARAALDQQLSDAQRQLTALKADKDTLTAQNTDLRNQVTQSQTSQAGLAAKGKRVKSKKRHH